MNTLNNALVTSIVTALVGWTCTTGPASDSTTSNGNFLIENMNTARSSHTATRLDNGNVLITGGFTNSQEATESAEIFIQETHSFLQIGSMNTPRQSHTATLLQNGKVLIAGGFNGDYLATTELYDPITQQFVSIAPLNIARSGHIAILLQNGKVLLAGGTGKGWSFLASAELFDPNTNTFALTGSMTTERESHTATLLNNGQVLITGGHKGRQSNITIYKSAEIYNPVTESFKSTSDLTIRRHKHDAILLSDGRVLISGGSDERDSRGAYNSTEVFNPNTNLFSSAPTMNSSRYKHANTSLLLDNNNVILVGGSNTTEIYNPELNKFHILNNAVNKERFFATATLLLNGEILFAGGYGNNIESDTRVWIFKP